MSYMSPLTIDPLSLPDRHNLCGPITRRRIVRLWVLYFGIFSLGTIVATVGSPAWQVFGLGLIVPGGGFLALATTSWQAIAHLAMFALAFSCFVAALFVWFATGNVVAPPLVWLLAAVLAAFLAAVMEHEGQPVVIWHIPAAAGVVMTLTFTIVLLRRRGASRHRQGANKYLAEAGRGIALKFRAGQESSIGGEFTERDLKLMRFVLDRALQPLPNYDGFEWIDQFQTAAVRYQLNFMGYALSMAQATRLPAFSGYLSDAQRRLIDKQTDHRIWRYWALENFWGNFAVDANPIARQNIMFSGFCATQMAMYHAATGRRDYEQAGSFTLRHSSGRNYQSDLPALIAMLGREQRRSAFHLITCEPNWIYPLCNSIVAAAMTCCDRGNGNQSAPREIEFRRSLENEFIDLAGRFVTCRSAYSGLALPVIGGALPQALASLFLNATLPDIALRQWLLLRRELVDQSGRGLRRSCFWPIDIGNYRFSRASAYAGTALAAAEMGDSEVARLCLDALDEECPATTENGWYRPNASVWTHAVELFARSSRANSFRDLMTNPRAAGPRPTISAAPYPDVLVARAEHADGMLAATLYSGQRPGRFRLGLSGLSPSGNYACDGTEEQRIAANGRGEAVVTVAIDARTEIRIRPMV